MLGSLHLETEDEPRRGASRANSVRFDETTLQGHFGHGSRASSDLFPLRTGSGLGSHPMTERSSSHKSDSRLSTTSQSIHFGRLNGLGLDVQNSAIGTPTSIGPPPGLFLLGPLPSIIRCWLDNNFSNESLLYAAICTGSYRSILSFDLVHRLGLDNSITRDNGEAKLKIQVYLPEAIIQQSSTRSGSPAPQLPSITVQFSVKDMAAANDSIQIFLGSDVLRAKNADILFSQNQLIMLDDEHNKLAIPLVRPENATVFQNLLTVNGEPKFSMERQNPDQPTLTESSNTGESPKKVGTEGADMKGAQHQQVETPSAAFSEPFLASYSPVSGSGRQPSAVGDRVPFNASTQVKPEAAPTKSENHVAEASNALADSTADTPIKPGSGNMWGSWRRDSSQNPRPDSSFSGVASGYQRAGRGRGMKVLKPARSGVPSRSTSTSQAPPGFDSVPARSMENNTSATMNDAFANHSPGTASQPFGTDAKPPLLPVTNRTRPSNPVGGASAFGWLNSSQQKQPSASMD
jgi:hypothetical protein